MSSEGKFDKKILEVEWANYAAKRYLPPAEFTVWDNLTSTFRTSLTSGRSLQVWRLEASEPVPIYHIGALKLDASLGDGLKLTLALPDGPLTVGHTPVKLPYVAAFIWCPIFAELRWVPADYDDVSGQRRYTLPVCLKLASNYVKTPTEGDTYVSTVAQLKRYFPKHG